MRSNILGASNECVLALFNPQVKAANELLATALGTRRATRRCHDRHALEENVAGTKNDTPVDVGQVVEWLEW